MTRRFYVAIQGIGLLYTMNEESNTLSFSSRGELSSSYTIALALREALGRARFPAVDIRSQRR